MIFVSQNKYSLLLFAKGLIVASNSINNDTSNMLISLEKYNENFNN